MKIEEFDTVILKNGQSAAVVEKLSEDTFIADIGDSPKDWDTITITINEIEKVAPRNLSAFFVLRKELEMKYRKKPVVIEAVQFKDTEESILELSELGLDPVRIDYADLSNPLLKIETLGGLMIATEGDYIIKGVQGEFYPCKHDIFKETYEKVEE